MEKYIVVWKDGTWKVCTEGMAWEYEGDPDWCTKIDLKAISDVLKKTAEKEILDEMADDSIRANSKCDPC